jgi:hypothetical protein
MNTKMLGNTFMEQRGDRPMSEVRKFQDFRTQRDIPDVTEGNRRFKDYYNPRVMKGLVEHQFGRKGRSMSHERKQPKFLSTQQTFVADNSFYSKFKSSNHYYLGMNSSRQREGSITLG